MSLTSTGFALKRQTQFIAELQERFRDVFGADINVDTLNPDSVGGQLIGIFSERFALLYEMAQALYDAGDPSAAEGIALDHLANILGISRKAATSTIAKVTLTGVAGTVVPAGAQYSTDTAVLFLQDSEATIGDDGTVTDVAVTALLPGATPAAATTIKNIAISISGLSSVTNPVAATTGTDVESDAELRLRMVDSSSVTGSTTVDAIRSRLLGISTVTSAQVVENATSNTVDGQPAHSIQCVVYPDQEDTAGLAQVIWDNKPAGIPTYGNQTAVVVTDSQGNDNDVYFSYASPVYVEVKVDISVDASFPSGGSDTIQNAVMNYVNNLTPGEDLQTFKIINNLSNTTGITSLDVNTRLDGTGSYTPDNVVISPVELARISALSKVLVVIT